MSGVIYEAQRWRLWRRLVRDKNRNILVSVVFPSFFHDKNILVSMVFPSFWSEIRILWFQWYFLFLVRNKNILVSLVFSIFWSEIRINWSKSGSRLTKVPLDKTML